MAEWPAVTHDRAVWNAPQPMMSRNQRRRAAGAYSPAVVPAIAGAPVKLAAEVDELVGEAERAIAGFAASRLGSLPFSTVLMRTESASSSQIEALTASARRLSLALLGDSGSPNAVMVARNVKAMAEATSRAGAIDLDAILAVHREILAGPDPHAGGRLRAEQVWIGGVSPVVARYVPPVAERVPAAMGDLIAFVARADVSPLAHAAIAHAQFETIHPFTDGNGRTGRALVTMMLRRAQLAPSVPVPLSAGLLANTDTYFDALEAYREGDPEQIVVRFAAAAHDAIDNALTLGEDIERARRTILDVALRRSQSFLRLAQVCVAEGAFTASTLVDAGIPLATAYRQLDRLMSAGVVHEERKIRGQRVWSVPAVFAALDSFAARAGKRTWR